MGEGLIGGFVGLYSAIAIYIHVNCKYANVWLKQNLLSRLNDCVA